MADLIQETLNDCLHAVGEERRERILVLLSDGELSVDELTRQLAASQPTISYHLQILRRAGLVRARHCGRQRFYRANPHRVADCCRTIQTRFGLGVPKVQK
jgi:ArsR family transcriptional regulator